MQKSIYDNKTKQRVLTVFCEMPQRYMSLRELAMRSGVSSDRLKPILRFLLKQEILNVAEKKQERYYQINKYSALYEELGKVFGSQATPLEKDFLTKLILRCGQVKFAALSGIFVGQVRMDVDLLVVGHLSLRRLEKCARDLNRIVGNEINYVAMSEREYQDRLYSFDWFIKEIKERDPVVLVDSLNIKEQKSRKRG